MKQAHGDFQINGADIDTTIYCPCGTSFVMYNNDCDYRCPNPECKRLYRAEIHVFSIEESDKEDNFVLIGHKYNEN